MNEAIMNIKIYPDGGTEDMRRRERLDSLRVAEDMEDNGPQDDLAFVREVSTIMYRDYNRIWLRPRTGQAGSAGTRFTFMVCITHSCIFSNA
jgi:hypothetical protein